MMLKELREGRAQLGTSRFAMTHVVVPLAVDDPTSLIASSHVRKDAHRD